MDFGPRNSSCITLWAPSGGVGYGMIGADSGGRDNYTRVITRWVGEESCLTVSRLGPNRREWKEEAYSAAS